MPGWTATLIVLGLALCISGLANWQLRRPYEARWLRLAPWTGIQFVAIFVALIMLAHFLTLVTGKHFGRGY
jgi:hypothetical protein